MKIQRKLPKAEVPSVAMGDIAFNLLIFFVILAKSQDDTHLRWEPAQAAKLEKSGDIKVRVLIDADANVHLNGQPVEDKSVNVTRLSKLIETYLEGVEPGKRSVALKVHRTTESAVFEPVIEAISQAGGDLIHILQESVDVSSPP